MELYGFTNSMINICHFQGRSFFAYHPIFDKLLEQKIEKKDDFGIVTCFNNYQYAILAQQLDKNGIDYINGFDNIDKKWDNRDKVGYILMALEKCSSEIVLICDANDVLINTLEGFLDKFKSCRHKILFNATTNNHPELLIDKIEKRDFMGRFRYFNAGCCIGYRKDLIKFYRECQKLIDKKIYNPWKSEQYVLRLVFAKYLEHGDDTICFDYNCTAFQTFANTQIEYNGEKFRVV